MNQLKSLATRLKYLHESKSSIKDVQFLSGNEAESFFEIKVSRRNVE